MGTSFSNANLVVGTKLQLSTERETNHAYINSFNMISSISFETYCNMLETIEFMSNIFFNGRSSISTPSLKDDKYQCESSLVPE